MVENIANECDNLRSESKERFLWPLPNGEILNYQNIGKLNLCRESEKRFYWPLPNGAIVSYQTI